MTRTATNRTMCMCMMKPNGNRLIIRYPTRGFFRDDETRFPEACRQVSGFLFFCSRITFSLEICSILV